MLDAILIDSYSFSDKSYGGLRKHLQTGRATLRYYDYTALVTFRDLPIRKDISRTVAIEKQLFYPYIDYTVSLGDQTSCLKSTEYFKYWNNVYLLANFAYHMVAVFAGNAPHSLHEHKVFP